PFLARKLFPVEYNQCDFAQWWANTLLFGFFRFPRILVRIAVCRRLWVPIKNGPGKTAHSRRFMSAHDNANVVLVVEDLEDDAKLLQLLLEQSGILNPVRVVLNCAEAIAYLQGAPPFADRTQHPLPGVIFLDLKLPGMD